MIIYFFEIISNSYLLIYTQEINNMLPSNDMQSMLIFIKCVLQNCHM